MNKNVLALAKLYDATAQGLRETLASQEIMYNDERIKERVRWLGDIAKTLSLVVQIENLRSRENKSVEDTLPPEETSVEDPALKKAQQKQNTFNPGNPNQDLGSFPGGNWKPFS
jgi:hypothetical protein